MSENDNQEVQLMTTSVNESQQQRRLRVVRSLSQIQTNQDLARFLGSRSVKLLTWLGKTKSNHYSTLYIRKKGKNSKLRVLHDPDNLMRIAQFQICSKILNWVDVPDYIYAFERDKSIPKMAVKHVGKAIVISMDIKEFFHTIKQNQVMLLLQSFGIGAMPARTLSELCTFKAFVPQGALTSPKLSNIISAKTFGPQIKAYCDGKGLTLTIYADDITVSSNDPQLNVGEVISAITNIITENGFRVNTRKTKVMRRYHRQYVCGVVVNEKTNLIRRERLRLRAIVHNVSVNGPVHEAEKSNTDVNHFINELRGKINWYTQLNKSKAEKLSAELSAALKLHEIEVQEVRVSPEGVVSSVEHGQEDDALPWEEATLNQTVTAPQPVAN